MKNQILLIGAVVFLALPTSAWAADIFGNWIAQVPGEWGKVETVFSFKAHGAQLTGTVSDLHGETAISEGKINGDEISFVVIHNWGENEVRMAYRGKVNLNEIKFTREIQGAMRQTQEFTAKREFQRNQDVPVQIQRAVPTPVPPPPR
jgi:hypothetical protein